MLVSKVNASKSERNSQVSLALDGVVSPKLVTAIKKLYSNPVIGQKIISGESGAAGLAGFIAIMTDPELFDLQKSLGINGNTRILCFSTEGATDPGNFQRIIDDLPS